MKTSSVAVLSTSLDDDAWDDLLSFIEEGRVIPIVGPELLQVQTSSGPRLLLDWAAEKLAVRLNVDTAELPEPCTLNDVACWFLASRGRREEAYVRLRSGGDDYDRKIQRNISRCSYFIPVISATTQQRHEGYFRREWSYALDRVRNMAEGALFILPVSLEATIGAEALVPDRFKALHFTPLPGGKVTPEFAQRLVEVMRGKAR